VGWFFSVYFDLRIGECMLVNTVDCTLFNKERESLCPLREPSVEVVLNP